MFRIRIYDMNFILDAVLWPVNMAQWYESADMKFNLTSEFFVDTGHGWPCVYVVVFVLILFLFCCATVVLVIIIVVVVVVTNWYEWIWQVFMLVFPIFNAHILTVCIVLFSVCCSFAILFTFTCDNVIFIGNKNNITVKKKGNVKLHQWQQITLTQNSSRIHASRHDYKRLSSLHEEYHFRFDS